MLDNPAHGPPVALSAFRVPQMSEPAAVRNFTNAEILQLPAANRKLPSAAMSRIRLGSWVRPNHSIFSAEI